MPVRPGVRRGGKTSMQAPSRPQPQGRGKYVLEIIAGCARLFAAVVQPGLRVAQPMDLGHGPWGNLCDRRVEEQVRGWLSSGVIWAVWFGKPCARDGRKSRAGLGCARVAVRLVAQCYKLGVYYAIDNPQSSRIWNWSPRRRLLLKHHVITAHVHMCCHDTQYNKHTLIRGKLAHLEDFTCYCRCQVPHEHLQGIAGFAQPDRKRKSVWKTTLAGKYPPKLCQAIASVLARSAPHAAWRRVGEPSLSGSWRKAVCRCTKTPEPKTAVVVPVCPRTYKCDWDDAIDFKLWRLKMGPYGRKGRSRQSQRPSRLMLLEPVPRRHSDHRCLGC
jgi:hypothetical protein